MTPERPPSLIGRRLGTYEVLSLLGAGGMGEVYRARDTKLNRDVALKVLPDAFARDADRLARFRREAQVVAALNHPHIVTIFSIEEQDPVPFMTMELVEGSTLDQGIPGGGLSLARFFDIAVALADALSAAHRKHLIHRDLKPANVMVTDDGHVKVLDFGLARTLDPNVVHLEEAVTSPQLTEAGTLLYENNRAMAKAAFERALELSPSYAMGRCWYAHFYLNWASGDFEHGIAEARHALDSDPLSAYLTMTLGVSLFTAGRLDEAIDTCRRAVQLDPESFVSRWALGIALGKAGRFIEAIATLDAAAVMSGRHSLALVGLAGVFGQAGKTAEALALHRELIDRTSQRYVSPAHLALTAEAAGQHEEAMAFARQAWDAREPSFILWARHFPPYRALHSDPRFAAILREMDSP